MGEVIAINPSETRAHKDDPQHIDAYGQIMLIGIHSDLCRHRNQEVDQERANELDGIVKRLGEALERYEP